MAIGDGDESAINLDHGRVFDAGLTNEYSYDDLQHQKAPSADKDSRHLAFDENDSFCSLAQVYPGRGIGNEHCEPRQGTENLLEPVRLGSSSIAVGTRIHRQGDDGGALHLQSLLGSSS